jgi:hypothetical protein
MHLPAGRGGSRDGTAVRPFENDFTRLVRAAGFLEQVA